MHLPLHLVADLALIAGLILVGADNLRLRQIRRRRLEEDAARAARALGGYTPVVIDGIELPDPQDERWRCNTYVLQLGPVSVSPSFVYVSDRRFKRDMSAEKEYVKAVWDAFNNRIIRTTIDNNR